MLSEEYQGLDNTSVPLKKEDDYYKLMDKLATVQYLKQARQPLDVSSVEGTTLPLPASDSKDGNEVSISTFTYVREMFAESLEDG